MLIIINKKNLKKSDIILATLLISFIMSFYGCSTAPDPQFFELEYLHERSFPLKYKMTVSWKKDNWYNYPSGYIALSVSPGTPPNPTSTWFIDYTNGETSGSSSITYIFPKENPTNTDYNIKAQFFTSYYNGSSIDETSSLSLAINYSKFRIIQLRMTGNDLWPLFSDPNKTYWGFTERDKAFDDANTLINIEGDINNLPIPSVPFTLSRLLEFTVNNAGGNINSAAPYGLNPDIAIICGVQNIPNDIGTNPSLTNTTTGFSWQRVAGQAPAMSYVRFDILRTLHNQPYDFARSVTSTSIHELGHARGIQGDDTAPGGIIPDHDGENAGICVMHQMRDINWDTTPTFCKTHLGFLKGIIW